MNEFITEQDFVSTLLFRLYQNGIETFSIAELAKKLYPYTLDSKYDVFKKGNLRLRRSDLDELIRMEGYSNDNITYLEPTNDIIHLNYNSAIKAKSLSEQDNYDILGIATEFGIRNKFENAKTNIYGHDPNKMYTLMNGKISSANFWSEIDTDGYVNDVRKYEIVPDYFYNCPYDGKSLFRYHKGTEAMVEVYDSTYVIIRTYVDDTFLRKEIYTKELDKGKLEKIVNSQDMEYSYVLKK